MACRARSQARRAAALLGGCFVKVRALIVDDELPARRRIQQLLAPETEIEVIGECGDGREAIASIESQRPDLLLLDVQMPEISGFDVLRALPSAIWPAVIFTTAYDEHALAAFEVHALDFLLKPIDPARFHEAVQRACRHIQDRQVAAFNQGVPGVLSDSSSSYLSRIAVKDGGRTIFVKVGDIDYLESAANYVVLHSGAANYILRETLTRLESRLPVGKFLRVNRSIIVNLEKVKEVQSASGGEHVIVLQNGKKFILARGLRELQERVEHL